MAKNSGLTAEIRVRRCYSCGAILQDKNPSENGYVTTEKFNQGDAVLCERCYKLRHFIECDTPKYDFNEDYITILNQASLEDALAIYVLNAFCLTGSILKDLGKFLPEKVIVVVTKRDVLPSTYSDGEIKTYVAKALEKEDIHPLDIILTANTSTIASNIDGVRDAINKYRDGKSVYVIGAYQVGKTSLISNLLKGYTNKTSKMVQTAPYPGTNLSVVSIPLDDDSYIFDIPGIYNSHSLVSFIEPKLLKFVIPRHEIKPETYSAKPEQSFLLSNLTRIDFTSGHKTDFTFYKSNDITIYRAKLNKADSELSNIANDSNALAVTEKIKSTADLTPHEIEADSSGSYRIRIVGLGYFNFTGNNQKLIVYTPENITVLVEKDGNIISE